MSKPSLLTKAVEVILPPSAAQLNSRVVAGREIVTACDAAVESASVALDDAIDSEDRVRVDKTRVALIAAKVEREEALANLVSLERRLEKQCAAEKHAGMRDMQAEVVALLVMRDEAASEIDSALVALGKAIAKFNTTLDPLSALHSKGATAEWARGELQGNKIHRYVEIASQRHGCLPAGKKTYNGDAMTVAEMVTSSNGAIVTPVERDAEGKIAA